MKQLSLSLAFALLIGSSAANATFQSMQEGVLFPDFDDPAAPQVFYLDGSGLSEYAGFFIGNVGKSGDPMDHIAFEWSGLPSGRPIASLFQAGANADGTPFGIGQGLEIRIIFGVNVLTMNFDSDHPSYANSAFASQDGVYRMVVTPLFADAGASANYWFSIASPVPEPASLRLLGAGLTLFAVTMKRRVRPQLPLWPGWNQPADHRTFSSNGSTRQAYFASFP